MFNQNYGYNTYQQPMYGMYQQPQVQQKIMGFNYASEDEIKGHFLSPNTQILALDKEQPFLYIKTADNLGRSTFTKYKYEEIKDVDIIVQKTEYLTKEDVKDLASKGELKALQDKLEAVLAKINGGVKNEQQQRTT